MEFSLYLKRKNTPLPLLIAEAGHPLPDQIIGLLAVTLDQFGLVVFREDLAQQGEPVLQRFDAVIVPLVGGDGHSGKTRLGELLAQLGAGGAVKHHVRVQGHQLLDVDLRAGDEAGLSIENLRVELAQQAVFRGAHAGVGHAHDLLGGVKEHRQHRGQGQDVAHHDALNVPGHLHRVVVVVHDGNGVALLALLPAGGGGLGRLAAPDQGQDQGQGQQETYASFP